MAKRRTSIYADAELIDRAKEVASQIEGMAMSNVFEMALEMYLPHIEMMAAAARKADPAQREEAVVEALMRSLMNTLRKEREEAE